jgi:predicted dinucleotide-binding enzyme
MKIGVIGTGSMGEVIIRKLSAAGHDLKIANSRGPESLKDFAMVVGARAVAVEDAVKEVDVVFLVIPNKNVPDLPEGLFAKVKPGTVVIDTLNYYPFRDGQIEDLDNGMVESDWVSKLIKYPVVKSFNTMFAHSMIRYALSSGSAARIALPFSGDEPTSKEIVAKLIDSVGFDPVDIGSIAESWRQEPGSPLYCTDLTKEDLLFWYPKTKRDLLPGRREQLVHLYFTWPKDVTLEEQLKEARRIFQNGLA